MAIKRKVHIYILTYFAFALVGVSATQTATGIFRSKNCSAYMRHMVEPLPSLERTFGDSETMISSLEGSKQFREFIQSFVRKNTISTDEISLVPSSLYIDLGLILNASKSKRSSDLLANFLGHLFRAVNRELSYSDSLERGELIEDYFSMLNRFKAGRDFLSGILEPTQEVKCFNASSDPQELTLPCMGFPQMRVLPKDERHIFLYSIRLDRPTFFERLHEGDISFRFLNKYFHFDQATKSLERRVAKISKGLSVLQFNDFLTRESYYVLQSKLQTILWDFEKLSDELFVEWNNMVNTPVEFRLVQILSENRLTPLFGGLKSSTENVSYLKHVIMPLDNSPSFRDARKRLEQILAVKVFL